jgi:hypothetical protein
MHKPEILGGVVHKMPADLRKALTAYTAALAAWNDITPLARNEWICWVENAKLIETREHRIKRTYTELAEGKRRPCCWIGCTHRTDKEISPSVQWVLDKQRKAK